MNMQGFLEWGLLLIWCCARIARAAERVDAKLRLQNVLETRHRREAGVTSHLHRRDATLPLSELDEMTSLGEDTQLEVTKTTTTVQGTKLVRMQEKFKGQVVSDAVVTLETDSSQEHVLDASGAFYRRIEQDTDGGSSLQGSEAFGLCQRFNYDQWLDDGDISHTKAEQEIFVDTNGHAYPGFFVQYLVLVQGDERRPTCIVDARDGSIVESWDALDYRLVDPNQAEVTSGLDELNPMEAGFSQLPSGLVRRDYSPQEAERISASLDRRNCHDCEATGTGGNLRIGKIHYGRLQRCLEVTKIGDTCYLENQYVRVVNNNFTTAEKNETGLEVASYDCREMDDEVNGAYSPLLDAFFYGTVVARMYEDWYGMRPLKDKLLFRVHFGQNYSNAMWNGYECQYGDGYIRMHPLVSIDIVGHEVGHGVTEQNSNLFYYQQWGAINEAFSDMAGETAQAYLDAADWVTGVEIMKNNGPPLRYFHDPQADNRSIAHADNFTNYLDPHLGSGVYNRLFYLLVHDYGLPIKQVFHVFLLANQMYWHHLSDYASGACDVMKAAYDLGQDGGLFRRAFSEVGIEVCDTDSHVLGLRNKEVYTDITVSRDIHPTFVFGFPGEVADGVEIVATSSHGNVGIVLSNKTWGAEQQHVEVYAKDNNNLQHDFSTNTSLHLTIELTTDGDKALTDVALRAQYRCLTELNVETKDLPSLYAHFLWEFYCPEEFKADKTRKEEQEKQKEEEGEEAEQEEEQEEERGSNEEQEGERGSNEEQEEERGSNEEQEEERGSNEEQEEERGSNEEQEEEEDDGKGEAKGEKGETEEGEDGESAAEGGWRGGHTRFFNLSLSFTINTNFKRDTSD